MKMSFYPLLEKAYTEHKRGGPQCTASGPHLTPVLGLRGPIKPGVDFLCPMVFPFCLLIFTLRT